MPMSALHRTNRGTQMRNRLTGATFFTRKPATYYGTSNRTSDGVPIYECVPQYSKQNPKIDLFTARGGDYICSTNFFPTVREALHYYSIPGNFKLKTPPTFGAIDRRKR